MSFALIESFRDGPPPVVPPPVVMTAYASPFAALVAQADRTVQSVLGGSPVTYRPAVGPEVAVTGVFDALYVLAKADPDAGVEVLGPAVFLLLADLPTDPELDDPTLVIDGVVYTVTERRIAGLGAIVLALRRLI